MAQDLAEQMRNQEIRDWARELGGWPDLADRGRLPAAVTAAYEAYEAARSGGDDGSGPDFAGAAAALGVQLGASPLDSDDDIADGAIPQAPAGDASGGGSAPPPPEQPGAGADPGAGLPPVSSLDEARQRVNAGKASPGWARPPGGGGKQAPAAGVGKRRTRKPAPPPPDATVIEATPAVLDDMAGKLAMLITVPGAWWESVDPVCGGAFAQQAPAIVNSMVPVMARSQAVLKLFATDALYFQLFAVAEAAAPVAKAVYGHHYSEEARKLKAARQRGEQQAKAEEEDLATMYPSSPRVTGHVPDYRPAQAQM